MHPDKKKNDARQEGEEPQKTGAPQRDLEKENENVAAAYTEASKDIDKDPDLSIHSPNDDLDEGETARLGGDKTDLV